MSDRASNLVTQFLPQLSAAAARGPILDLACGYGRNGLSLIEAGVDVVFADRSVACLESIQQGLEAADISHKVAGMAGAPTFWSVDFETPNFNALAGRAFGGAIVFRYLHRPLFGPLRNAIAPGGLVIYETFTVDQPQYGRPKNPDFLLRHGELEHCFSGWEVLHSAEGVQPTTDGAAKRAVAAIVARKPDI